MYGRGFRNPNDFELYFDDNGVSQKANLSLQPETADTYEFDAEKQFTKRIRGIASAYHYRISNLIQQTYTSSGLAQYVNASEVQANGLSMQLDYKLPAGIETSSSLELQRAVYVGGSVLPNSPGQIGKFQMSLPLFKNRVSLGGGVQALGQRQTLNGVMLPWSILPELMVSTKKLPGGLDLTGGIKNLSNSFYREPAGLVQTVDSMIGGGRVYYLSVTWQRAEEQSAGGSRANSAKPEK
jgi:iron complex outermembrane receptor protein